MTCRDLLRRLADRETGRLNARRAAELEAHLRSCAACRQTASRFFQGMEDLEQAYAGRDTLDLAPRILARLNATPVRRLVRWALALAELTLAGFLTLLPTVAF